MSSLFVSNLGASVTTAVLQEYFLVEGGNPPQIVLRPTKKNPNEMNAIVTFPTKDLAEKALRELNYGQVAEEDGKTRELHLTLYDPERKYQKPKANVFIKNLPEGITSSDLDDAFRECGDIFSSVVRSRTFTKKEKNEEGEEVEVKTVSCRGYIQFMEEEAAQKAIEAFNGASFNDKEIQVQLFCPQSRRFRNVYIKYIPKDFTQEQFEELMKKYGDISSAKLIMADEGSEDVNKGYGYCSYSTNDAAMKAISELNGTKLEGQEKALSVSRYIPSTVRKMGNTKVLTQYGGLTKAKALFIQNFGGKTKEDLEKIFAPYGDLVSVSLRTTSNKQHTFAFINFETSDSVSKVLAVKDTKEFKDQFPENFQLNTRTPTSKSAKGKKTFKRGGQRPAGARGTTKSVFGSFTQEETELVKNLVRLLRQQQQSGMMAPMGVMPGVPAMGQMAVPSAPIQGDMGAHLHAIVSGFVPNPETAGKVTGMILDSVPPAQVAMYLAEGPAFPSIQHHVTDCLKLLEDRK
ncbi:hypothetical protein ADUPG1_010364 [Aduncisulcus paluster]|uniref:RRM domain-containing protein n=1 Tax=Aduncisulcus paluster TaxID=2918883 RepID=A0ABQ5JR34_9EUKA|nr:hypothetical protein ADUPG1_010364 [Aduncisulcus paluster]